MAIWHQAKIRYQKVDENDKSIKITEVYLVDAVSYTEAEARIYDNVGANIPDFTLFGLSRMKVAEVFFVENGAETWFKVKVVFVSFDDKSKKDKKIPYIMLINAKTPFEAYNLIAERLENVDDYQITDINITNILEVLPYDKPEEKILRTGNFVPVASLMEN